MDRLFIGIDGGGSKTLFSAVRADGTPVAQAAQASTSYRQYGFATVGQRIRDGICACLESAGAQSESVGGYCFGMPCYGESEAGDTALCGILHDICAPKPIYVCNDVEVGWAGSLGCHSGVNVVAGTGAVAFGRNDAGQTARAGGWTEFFGDEGSGYWVGRRAMELFSKQADGRIPRGALYDIIHAALHLKNDFEFIAVVEQDYMPYRDKTASFQRFAEQAALAGDESCVDLYEQAAHELALNVETLFNALRLPEHTSVSYSGGLFKAGELLLKPFSQRIEQLGGVLQQPLYSPVHGAALLAIERFSVS